MKTAGWKEESQWLIKVPDSPKRDYDESGRRVSEKDRSDEHVYSPSRLPQQQHSSFAALFGRQKAQSYGIGYTVSVFIRLRRSRPFLDGNYLKSD